MADQNKESTSLVTEYLREKEPEMARIHDAFAVESSFNESKSKYEARDKHEYVHLTALLSKVTENREAYDLQRTHGSSEGVWET
jgi:hypothetical protein